MRGVIPAGCVEQREHIRPRWQMPIYLKLWIFELILFYIRNQNLFMYGSTLSYVSFTQLALEAVWKMVWNGDQDDGRLNNASGRKTEIETQRCTWLTAVRERILTRTT